LAVAWSGLSRRVSRGVGAQPRSGTVRSRRRPAGRPAPSRWAQIANARFANRARVVAWRCSPSIGSMARRRGVPCVSQANSPTGACLLHAPSVDGSGSGSSNVKGRRVCFAQRATHAAWCREGAVGGSPAFRSSQYTNIRSTCQGRDGKCFRASRVSILRATNKVSRRRRAAERQGVLTISPAASR